MNDNACALAAGTAAQKLGASIVIDGLGVHAAMCRGADDRRALG